MSQSTEPFDLISQPDADSRDLRDQLQQWVLAAGLAGARERVVLPSREVLAVATDALDLLQQLLLLRRCLIVLMQSEGTEALGLPFEATVLASAVPLRVVHDPRGMPHILQLLLPGEGLVTISSPAYAAPPPSFDSDSEDEVRRLRGALVEARQALGNAGGPDTVLALIDVSLRR